ncbi:AfsR/SARP family transcriptional regulator [Streptomyces sp. H39-S7]|uniref:AfsR/SARP family transcriptional regulator n=1 Tax=Streptomyces sp. H39-S7 TaxID=3004357 RepID=UPI0022AFB23B|nr:AfsR/SARP family transcriptional regulator [Streptomyces sp. H39-S7]MCZ4124630.1 AfsR/SARP family transcriptional regulator [Streptomyces sp. H39-S7]
MNIGVLGPLYVSLDDTVHQVELAPKPRTVLAVLLANAGRVVPVSSLVREIWEDDPPVSALRNVQTYVFQSRKVLQQFTGLSARSVAGELLMTKPGGYVFSDRSAQFDYGAYRSLVTDGRGVIRQGDDAEGLTILSRALDIWRGPAFVDVTTGFALEAQRRELEESRLGVIEDLSDVKIRMGMYHEAIADLAVPVFEHPLHEGLHCTYMRALSMSGDRVRALDVFGRLRLNLVSDLGIEPGTPVQELQYRILNSG